MTQSKIGEHFGICQNGVFYKSVHQIFIFKIGSWFFDVENIYQHSWEKSTFFVKMLEFVGF